MATTVDRVTLDGARELEHTLDGMQARYLEPQGAYELVVELLEQNEVAIFRRAKGRWVKSGDTKASLTEHGADAIRRVLGTQLEFGSSVWYAHFLTRKIGPGTGKHGGLKRTGGSAVLRLTSYRRNQISQKVLDYCVVGERGLATTSLRAAITGQAET